MTTFKMAAMTFVLIGSQCGIAFAQGGSEAYPAPRPEGSMTYTEPTGVSVTRTLAPDEMAEIMQNGAMPMTEGVMTMMHGGKMYMVINHKMANGHMMSDLAMPGMIKK